MTLDEIKALLAALNLPAQFITDQTAICILTLADRSPRSGLLPEHVCLSDGARIHDILNFARTNLGRQVAENTRESYRKSSLRPLMNAGFVVRHQLSTNDPNTYYRLHASFARLLSTTDPAERDRLVERLRLPESVPRRRSRRVVPGQVVTVRLNENTTYELSPGEHNALERAVVESFATAFLVQPEVVCLGDAAVRGGYQNRPLMRRLNLPIDVAATLPDAILYCPVEQHLVIVEAVTSVGAIDAARMAQFQQLVSDAAPLVRRISFVTAFPSRTTLRRFVESIAWGSNVWIESELGNLIHFQAGLHPTEPGHHATS
jgi:hypothetical protein